MKKSDSGKNSLSKEWLAGLKLHSNTTPNPGKTDTIKPAFAKTSLAQPDLAHDAGNGYNPDNISIQR